MECAAALTPSQSARLAELEKVIDHGLQHFLDVGHALAEIREKQLYLPHETFDDYCRTRWDISRQRAGQLMRAAAAYDNIKLLGVSGMETVVSIPDKDGSKLPEPTSERQLRGLTDLEPEQQREAWADASHVANGEVPTGQQVAAAAKRAGILCARCSRVGAVKDCPSCKEARAEARATAKAEREAAKRDESTEPEEPQELVDEDFKPVPEHARPAFEAAAEINALSKDIDAVIRVIADSRKKPGWEMVLADSVIQTLKNARMTLRHSKATHVCPYCQGKAKTPACNCCKGRGWTTKDIWKNCPAIVERDKK